MKNPFKIFVAGVAAMAFTVFAATGTAEAVPMIVDLGTISSDGIIPFSITPPPNSGSWEANVLFNIDSGDPYVQALVTPIDWVCSGYSGASYSCGRVVTSMNLYKGDTLVESSFTMSDRFRATSGAWVGLGSFRLNILGDLAQEARGNLYVSGTAPVPEPDTYAIMLVGLGLLGVVASRRKI
jgi:hypothetical protein